MDSPFKCRHVAARRVLLGLILVGSDWLIALGGAAKKREEESDEA